MAWIERGYGFDIDTNIKLTMGAVLTTNLDQKPRKTLKKKV